MSEAERERDQYRRMIDLWPDAIFVHIDGVFVYVNDATVRLIGVRSREDLIGKSLFSFIAPELEPSVRDNLRLLVEERGEPPKLIQKFTQTNGTILDIELTAIRLEWEGRDAVQVIVRDITERVRQNEALRASEARFRGLIERASEAVFRLSPAGDVLSVNPACARITGLSEERLLGMNFRSVMHPDDFPGMVALIEKTLGGRGAMGLFRVIRPDGAIAWVDVTTAPELHEGTTMAVFGIARDVTRERQASELVAERERLLSAVIDQLPVGVVIADATGEIIRSNPASNVIWSHFRKQTAIRSRDRFRGWWADTGMPLEAEEWASSRALRTGETSLGEVIDIESFDGVRKTILNSAIPLRNPSGAIEGVVILNQDVTEQRETARQKEALSARFKQVISSTSDAICTVDREERITLANPAAAAMLGYEEAKLIGRRFHELVDGGKAGRSNAAIEVMRTREARPLFADSFRNRAGFSYDVEASCAPIIVEDEVVGAVIAFRDVTERNAIERELERNRRLSSLGELAATVAHEFNNVMMGIMPFLDLIVRRFDEDDTLRPMATHVTRALRRAKQITGEVLKFAQSSEPELHPIRLRELLESSVDELRSIAGPETKVQIGLIPDDIVAQLDRNLVLQVLSNLIANARDAMSGQGVIRIETALADREADRRRLPLADPREYVRISVVDDGCGIEDVTMSRIFEPLFTTKRSGGTGLGLAVVQQIVRRHGGVVAVESSPGAGAAFHLYFRRGTLPESAEVANVAKQRRAADRVLIVEDDESVAAGLTAILASEGISVQVAGLGRDAIPSIEAFRPDAVVLDRGLPDADGVDVCRQILQRWPAMPIVFSTGHGSRADLGEMLDLPNVVHLLKPYDIDTLLDSMAQAMTG